MFQINEDDLSFGEEDFWSEALEVEAASVDPGKVGGCHQPQNARVSGSSDSKPTFNTASGNHTKLTGNIIAQIHSRPTGIPAAGNCNRPISNPLIAEIQSKRTGNISTPNHREQEGSPSTDIILLMKPSESSVEERFTAQIGAFNNQNTRDSPFQKNLVTTPGHQKRKFSFKQKSPRGGTSISTTENRLSKRPKGDGEAVTALNISNVKTSSGPSEKAASIPRDNSGDDVDVSWMDNFNWDLVNVSQPPTDAVAFSACSFSGPTGTSGLLAAGKANSTQNHLQASAGSLQSVPKSSQLRETLSKSNSGAMPGAQMNNPRQPAPRFSIPCGPQRQHGRIKSATANTVPHTSPLDIQNHRPPYIPPQGNTTFIPRTPGFHGRGPLPLGSRFGPGTPNSRSPINLAARTISTPTRYQGFSTHGGKPQSRAGTIPSPQTPRLTSKVAQMLQTPVGGAGTGPCRSGVRKFPGPAGILPKLTQGQKMDSVKLPSPEISPETPSTCSTGKQEVASSQDVNGDIDFSQGAWQTMKTDLDLCEDNPNSILAKNNIASVLRKASLNQLTKNKVPHLCVVVKAVTFTNTDASTVLRDPTGEIQGTIHRRLVDEHQTELKPGSVLVLRQVGVLSPTLRNHYLNITPSNLIQLYPSEATSQSSQKPSDPTTPRSTASRHGRKTSLGSSMDIPTKSHRPERITPKPDVNRSGQCNLPDREIDTTRRSGHFSNFSEIASVQTPAASEDVAYGETGRPTKLLGKFAKSNSQVTNEPNASADVVNTRLNSGHLIEGSKIQEGRTRRDSYCSDAGSTSNHRDEVAPDTNRKTYSVDMILGEARKGGGIRRSSWDKSFLDAAQGSSMISPVQTSTQRQEDFTELLADIGDDFFEDF